MQYIVLLTGQWHCFQWLQFRQCRCYRAANCHICPHIQGFQIQCAGALSWEVNIVTVLSTCRLFCSSLPSFYWINLPLTRWEPIALLAGKRWPWNRWFTFNGLGRKWSWWCHFLIPFKINLLGRSGREVCLVAFQTWIKFELSLNKHNIRSFFQTLLFPPGFRPHCILHFSGSLQQIPLLFRKLANSWTQSNAWHPKCKDQVFAKFTVQRGNWFISVQGMQPFSSIMGRTPFYSEMHTMFTQATGKNL